MKPLDAVVLRDGRLTLRPPAESDVPAITTLTKIA